MTGADAYIFHDEVDQALYLRGELAFLIFVEKWNLFFELFNSVRHLSASYMSSLIGSLCPLSVETRNRAAAIFLSLCFRVAPQFELLLTGYIGAAYGHMTSHHCAFDCRWEIGDLI